MRAKKTGIVISCEHGGNRIPAKYANLFRGHRNLLETHRAWDPGAAAFARFLGRSLHAPCFVATTTRLLVDLNRSIGNRNLFSPVSRSLDREERERMLTRHYHPHRKAVESAVDEGIAEGLGMVHIAVHSFVPVLNGVERTCDVSLLYDPARKEESAFCATWIELLRANLPGLRVRRNYPYRGVADGFCTHLRRRLPGKRYIGVELELNQRILSHQSVPARDARLVRKALIETLAAALRTS